MTHDPYAPPQTDLADFPEAAPTMELAPPAEILKQIRNATMAACISGGLTLALSLLGAMLGSVLGLNAWSLLDAALIFGLAYGLHRRSRVCAVLLLIYWIGAKALQAMGNPTAAAGGALFALLFGWFYLQGVLGTFRYQAWLKAAKTGA
jgi:hypothetical protein